MGLTEVVDLSLIQRKVKEAVEEKAREALVRLCCKMLRDNESNAD
jgi:hypothetical protein